MCGIAGAVWTQNGPPLDEEVLRRMAAVLRHRGPDDDGFYHRDVQSRPGREPVPGVALGFQRLSIIDLAGGHQPMSNEDGTVWVVFNGEIYNFADLRHRLEGNGHRFRTESDTEVIVHLYEDEGAACVRKLRGMFAFAVWDAQHRRLLLARDRLGQKPLVYRLEAERLLFASEIKALLQVPGVPREMDHAALDHYLTYQYVPHPRSIFRGIHKLPPAHYAVFHNGTLEVQRYWEPEFDVETDVTRPQCREQLREQLTEAVRLRMIADVPLGAFLSGGIDSTIIVGLMQQLADEPVKTFSIGFPVAAFDETAYARQAAEHLGTDHHEFQVRPDAIQVLPQLVWHFDEPFADNAAIPTYYLSQWTRQHVKVALTGDAGDELFLGYPRYRAVRIGGMVDRLPPWMRAIVTSRLWQKLPASVEQKSRLRQFKKLLAQLAQEPRRRYLAWTAIFGEARRAQLYTDEFLQSLDEDPAQFLLDAYARCRRRDFVTRTADADLLTYLPDDLLTKVDITSMAHSLECRSPLLDHHVVEFAVGMPRHLKMRGLRGKRILIDTFRDLLPAAIQKRPKMGFGVPLDHWFRNELRAFLREVLLDPVCLGRGYFRREIVERLVDDHLAGHWDHSYRLWALLFFELWHRTFLDAAACPTEAAPELVPSL
jgi:asparagine synthase (glutamine-hydrolysing)